MWSLAFTRRILCFFSLPFWKKEDLKTLSKSMEKALDGIELFSGRTDQARSTFRVLRQLEALKTRFQALWDQGEIYDEDVIAQVLSGDALDWWLEYPYSTWEQFKMDFQDRGGHAMKACFTSSTTCTGHHLWTSEPMEISSCACAKICVLRWTVSSSF